MDFCTNMRRLRKGKHISQSVVAEKLNVSQRTISHYENGTCQPSIEGLIKLADMLEVSIDELVGHTPLAKQYGSLFQTLLQVSFYVQTRRKLLRRSILCACSIPCIKSRHLSTFSYCFVLKALDFRLFPASIYLFCFFLVNFLKIYCKN